MRREQDCRSPATVKIGVFSALGNSTLDHPQWNQTYDILSGGPPLSAFVTFLVRHEENILLAIIVDLYSSGSRTSVRER